MPSTEEIESVRAVARTLNAGNRSRDVSGNYVTMRNGSRLALLDGPFETREEAVAAVPAAIAWAEARDAWAHFYTFAGAHVAGERLPVALMRREPPIPEPEATPKRARRNFAITAYEHHGKEWAATGGPTITVD